MAKNTPKPKLKFRFQFPNLSPSHYRSPTERIRWMGLPAFRPRSCLVRPVSAYTQVGIDIKTPPPGTRSFTKRTAGVRLGSVGRVWYGFCSSKTAPLAAAPRRGGRRGRLIRETIPNSTPGPQPDSSRPFSKRPWARGWGLYICNYPGCSS